MQVKGAYFFLSDQCFNSDKGFCLSCFSAFVLSFFFFTQRVKKKERDFAGRFQGRSRGEDSSAETGRAL